MRIALGRSGLAAVTSRLTHGLTQRGRSHVDPNLVDVGKTLGFEPDDPYCSPARWNLAAFRPNRILLLAVCHDGEGLLGIIENVHDRTFYEFSADLTTGRASRSPRRNAIGTKIIVKATLLRRPPVMTAAKPL